MGVRLSVAKMGLLFSLLVGNLDTAQTNVNGLLIVAVLSIRVREECYFLCIMGL